VLRHLFSDPYVCSIVITNAIYSINIVYTIENCDIKNLHLCLNKKCLYIKVRKIYENIKINSYKFYQ